MKVQFSKQRNHALTLVELVLVVFILAFFVAMFLPALTAHHNGRQRINCVNNLKQIGLAYRIWGGDNGDKYPMQTSVTNGDTMELINGRNAWINFFVMSNELGTPKILHCPEDLNGFAATNFSTGFNNQNVSYFVNVDASDAFL